MAVGLCCCALGAVSSPSSGELDRSTACGGVDQVGPEIDETLPVRLLRGPAPALLANTPNVLREPQAAGEELPRSALARLGLDEVWVDAVRRITTNGPWDIRTYLIPGVSGHGRCSPQPSRAPSREPLVSMDMYNSSGRMGARAYSVDDIVAGRAFRIYPLPATGAQQELVLGLVPDGVSSVEVKANDMPGQAVHVHDNYFEASIPVSEGNTSAVTSVTTAMTWYGAAGNSIKTISAGTRQAFLLDASVDIPGT
jgi:hypothetical protein